MGPGDKLPEIEKPSISDKNCCLGPIIPILWKLLQVFCWINQVASCMLPTVSLFACLIIILHPLCVLPQSRWVSWESEERQNLCCQQNWQQTQCKFCSLDLLLLADWRAKCVYLVIRIQDIFGICIHEGHSTNRNVLCDCTKKWTSF